MRYIFTVLCLLSAIVLSAQETEPYNQIEIIDFNKATATIRVLPQEQKVVADITYAFTVLNETDSLFIDARNMQFKEVKLNGDSVNYKYDGTKIWIFSKFFPSQNKTETLKLSYTAAPEAAMYFINWNYPDKKNITKQVWTQGQGKNNSHWLPSFDDMREKVEFDLSFEFLSKYDLISNGKLVQKTRLNDSLSRWQFNMEEPMSSYLIAMAAGDFYSRKLTSGSGIPMEFYLKPDDSSKFEPTYRHSVEIMDFLEQEIGIKYPWQNYKNIAVQDFIYAGMENTGTTIFANSLVTDSIGFKDRNYVNVNAHELAHQWFGNMVTGKTSKEHWLHEGFASYYALLAEREIFGEDYYYWKLYQSAERLKELSDKGKGEALLRDGASSLTYYEKGAWALHMLREKIGDAAFKKGMQSYLKLYQFKVVDTDNFIAEMEGSSGMDLSEFVANWLKQSAFKANAALNSLKQSTFITSYLEIAALRETPLAAKYEALDKALSFPVNDYIGQEVVYQLAGYSSSQAINLYKKAFKTNNFLVRQAVATSTDKISTVLKQDYESLLEDDSYLTQEAALFNLWQQFPQERNGYLEQTQHLTGFYDKNIRMLWLTLSLATPEYKPEKTEDFYKELAGYSLAWQPFELRENAFGYLYQLDAFNQVSLESLIAGTDHHNSGFKKFCRQLLTELLKNEKYQQELQSIVESLPDKTKFLESKFNN